MKYIYWYLSAVLIIFVGFTLYSIVAHLLDEMSWYVVTFIVVTVILGLVATFDQLMINFLD